MPRNITLTNLTGITTAISATAGTAYDVPVGTKAISFQSILTVGGGGTTADIYFQTTLDNGATWVDISNHHYTTSTATKVSTIIAATAVTPAAPTDGSLASNTNTSGLIGSQIRAKHVTVGTYTATTTLTATVQFNK